MWQARSDHVLFTNLRRARDNVWAWTVGEVNRFVRNGVILQDNSFLPADVVLYCTGYEKTYDYFDGEMRSRLGLQKDGLYLYRNCLPPGVPQLAFVGSEVRSRCSTCVARWVCCGTHMCPCCVWRIVVPTNMSAVDASALK